MYKTYDIMIHINMIKCFPLNWHIAQHPLHVPDAKFVSIQSVWLFQGLCLKNMKKISTIKSIPYTYKFMLCLGSINFWYRWCLCYLKRLIHVNYPVQRNKKKGLQNSPLNLLIFYFLSLLKYITLFSRSIVPRFITYYWNVTMHSIWNTPGRKVTCCEWRIELPIRFILCTSQVHIVRYSI